MEALCHDILAIILGNLSITDKARLYMTCQQFAAYSAEMRRDIQFYSRFLCIEKRAKAAVYRDQLDWVLYYIQFINSPEHQQNVIHGSRRCTCAMGKLIPPLTQVALTSYVGRIVTHLVANGKYAVLEKLFPLEKCEYSFIRRVHLQRIFEGAFISNNMTLVQTLMQIHISDDDYCPVIGAAIRYKYDQFCIDLITSHTPRICYVAQYLSLAAEYNNIRMVNYLYDIVVNIVNEHAVMYWISGAAHIAMQKNHIDVVRALIAKGYDMEMLARIAMENYRFRILRLILSSYYLPWHLYANYLKSELQYCACICMGEAIYKSKIQYFGKFALIYKSLRKMCHIILYATPGLRQITLALWPAPS